MNLSFVVHVPSLVVLFPLVVVIGPVGVSLAETITVRVSVQLVSSQSWSGIEVGPQLHAFRGVLTGQPVYTGGEAKVGSHDRVRQRRRQ